MKKALTITKINCTVKQIRAAKYHVFIDLYEIRKLYDWQKIINDKTILFINQDGTRDYINTSSMEII